MREPGSETLRSELARHADGAKIISAITHIEVRSAIAKLARMNLISAFEAAKAKGDVEAQITHFTTWRIEPLLDDASRLVEERSLRTLDALQLACAVEVKRFLPRTDTLIFIASDQRLLEAARFEGLPIWNPELYTRS